MLYVANPREAKQVAKDIKLRIDNEKHYRKQVHINHPNGGESNANVYFLESLPLWIYFKHVKNNNLWLFWCGTYDKNDIVNITKINIGVELNVRIEQYSKQSSTRALLDAGHRSYIGHKGMLKGGGSGSVSMKQFENLIRHFSKQPIAWDGANIENIFVISEINDPEFFNNILKYVKECERIRDLARRDKIKEEFYNKPYFSPGTYGMSKKSATEPTTMSRVHEYVLKELFNKIKENGIAAYNSPHKNMQPDMYTHDENAYIDRLFEIKTDASTQSFYTAIGQLLVYAAEMDKEPQKFLVAPALPAHHGFRAALSENGIKLIRFYFTRKGVIFDPSSIVDSN